MNSRDFYQQFADLKFWKLDADEIATQLEKAIRNDTEVKFFTDEVSALVRESHLADTNTYLIEINDSDLIKYIKSFINFVRAVKGIDRNIVRTYINHLLSPPGWMNYSNYTDTELYSIIKQAYRNSDQFINLYDHFMAFRFYMVEVGDMIVQLPLLPEKSKNILKSLMLAYGKSHTKNGVDSIVQVLKKQKEKTKSIVDTRIIPALEINNLSNVLVNFGLRTHLDALTQMAGILNANNQRYYSKLSNQYYFPPTVSKPQRKLMNAYNECAAARMALDEAAAAYEFITVNQPVNPTGTWSTLDDKVQQQYINLNDAMYKLNGHLAAVETNVLAIPALAKIYKRDKRVCQQQIYALTQWNDSPSSKYISDVKNSLGVNDVFEWIRHQIDTSISAEDKAAWYQKAHDRFLIPANLPAHQKNILLSYNMNSRMKDAYKLIEKLRTNNFSFDYISTAHHLLYEIGHIVKSYKELNNPDLIKQIKQRLELDLNLLLTELARFYHHGIKLAKELELQQGLKDGLLMDKLQAVYGGYCALLQLNKELPAEYKLAIDCNLMAERSIIETINLTTQHVQLNNRLKRYRAFKANNALFESNSILCDNSYQLSDLVKILAQLQSLPGHHASLYASHLQTIIDKMVGLNALEDEIRAMEQAVKIIINDNIENLAEYANNESITPYLKSLRELYRLREELRAMLASMAAHKDNAEQLHEIPVKHFVKRGHMERAKNYFWTFLFYEEVGTYCLEPGIDQTQDLTPLTKEIPQFHGIILKEIGDILSNHPEAESETESTYSSQSDEDDISSDSSTVDEESELAAVEEVPALADEPDLSPIYSQSNEAMLKHVIDSRKGFIILQSEWLRHKLVNKSLDYIHEDHQQYLGQKYKGNNGIYHIRKKDCIAVVNVKCVHNSMIRIERTLELINYISEIPTDVKVSNWGAIPRISAILSQLKIGLNELFAELALLTEAMTALRDGMKNNTFNLFEQDLMMHLRKMLRLLQQAVDFYYSDTEDNNQQQAFMQKAIEDVIDYSLWLSPEPTQAASPITYSSENELSDTEDNAVEIEEIDGEDIVKEALGGLEVFLQSSGQADGMLDLSKLEKNSLLHRVGELLNKMRGKVKTTKAPDSAKDTPEQEADNTSVISSIKENVSKAGELFKHLATAREILKSMTPEQRANADNQLIVFMKIFVERSGKAAVSKYRDGSYKIHLLKDGTMQKFVAAFLNITNDINKFLDSTVSMANGHHIIGLIKALNDLSDIKSQVDQSRLLGIIDDTILQYNFDSAKFSERMNAVIVKALNYLQPKIIDTVAQARIAEVTLGTSENLLRDHLESALDAFIKLGKKFASNRFDDIKKGFPYDEKTLEIARIELNRLGALNLSSASEHHFLNNAIASLQPFAKNLARSIPYLPILENDKSFSNLTELDAMTDAESLPSAGLIGETDNTSVLISSESSPKLGRPNANDKTPRVAPAIVLAVPKQRPAISADENTVAQMKINALSQACLDYKHHLACEINRLRTKAHRGVTSPYKKPDISYDPLPNADDKLALTIEKYNVILDLQVTLNSSEVPSQKLTDFSAAFTVARRDKISERRDTPAMLFLKRVAAIVTFGVLYGLDALFDFGIYKPRGKKLAEEITQLVPPTVTPEKEVNEIPAVEPSLHDIDINIEERPNNVSLKT